MAGEAGYRLARTVAISTGVRLTLARVASRNGDRRSEVAASSSDRNIWGAPTTLVEARTAATGPSPEGVPTDMAAASVPSGGGGPSRERAMALREISQERVRPDRTSKTRSGDWNATQRHKYRDSGAVSSL